MTDAISPPPAEKAVHDALLLAWEDTAIEGRLTIPEVQEAAAWAVHALRSLPVEQRMDAMGMTVYGEVVYDDESETDTVPDAIEVVPGAVLYVEAEMRWTDG